MEDRTTNIVVGICLVLMVILLIGWFTDDVLHLYEPKSVPPKQKTEQTFPQKRANQQEIDNDYAQIKTKARTKINDLSYSIVKEIRVTSDGTSGQAEYAVKKLSYMYQNGEYKQGTESKVYEITVRFKKYGEFEIIDVELFDRGNLTMRKLN